MCIAVLELRLDVPWVHSLKQKRSEVKPLLAKLRAKFNVSVAETAEADTHQTIMLTLAAVAAYPAQADSILDTLLQYVQANTEEEVYVVRREML